MARRVPDAPVDLGPMSGTELIAQERARQIQELGYTAEHDRDHGLEDLTDAAAAYVTRDHNWWPWERPAFKLSPVDRRRELVKAGALIAAAIDAMGPR